MALPIQVEQLTKNFGTLAAVDGISFEVKTGEIFGILGPNGAGKTTTIRVLTGILPPTSGNVRVLGMHVPEDLLAIREQIGVLPETANVYGDMTGEQNLLVSGLLYGLERHEIKERATGLLKEMSLYERRKKPAKTYSKGMKQRLSLAMTLMSEGQLLFLDEPTSGLDPESALRIRKVIADLASTQRTVVLTTHNMKEAEELCDRVAIMNHGKLAAVDTPRNLRKAFQERQSILIEFSDVPDLTTIHSMTEVTEVRLAGTRVRCFTSDPSSVLIELVELAKKEGLRILHVQTEDASLEDVFLDLTRGGE